MVRLSFFLSIWVHFLLLCLAGFMVYFHAQYKHSVEEKLRLDMQKHTAPSRQQKSIARPEKALQKQPPEEFLSPQPPTHVVRFKLSQLKLATPIPGMLPTATPTPTPTAIPTATPTATPTFTPTPTAIPTATPTFTPTPTAIPTATPTFTPTPTAIPTATPTFTPTPTAIPTATPTFTPTPTAIPTATPTFTPTPTAIPTATPTFTPPPTAIPTASPTFTAMPTATPTAIHPASPTPEPILTPATTPLPASTQPMQSKASPEFLTSDTARESELAASSEPSNRTGRNGEGITKESGTGELEREGGQDGSGDGEGITKESGTGKSEGENGQDGSGDGSPEISGNAEEALIAAYLDSISQKIRKKKRYPRKARRAGWEGIVVVEAVILASGEVSSLRTIEPSKYPVLEKAAGNAIENAQPFPKFPEELNRDSIIVAIPIHFTLR